MTKKIYLKAEIIHKYLSGDDDTETLIMCKPETMELVTTDQSLYEALGSIEKKTELNYNKLVKFLENVDVMSFKQALRKERKILKEERVAEIRKKSKHAKVKIESQRGDNNAR